MEDLQGWFRREPAIVVSLLILSAALFVVTYLVTTAFRREQRRLAQEYYSAGQAAVASVKPFEAIEEFHTALLYDPGNNVYRFELARALALAGRNKEALSHLISLWESEPGNGELNLEIARVAVRMNDPAEATRFFHGAIYGVWPDDPDGHRREARLELAKFLVGQKQLGQAEAELVALSTDLPNNTPLRIEVGTLYNQTGDSARALQQFRAVLAHDADNRTALIGAAQAAFQIGQYWTAASYLTRAAAGGTLDGRTQDLLHTSQLILDTDPFRRGISSHERAMRVAMAFDVAGERLQQCLSSKNLDVKAPVTPASSPLQRDYAKWRDLESTSNGRYLRRDPDSIDKLMNLVFEIETDTQEVCGTPSGRNLALLLISRGRSGGEK